MEKRLYRSHTDKVLGGVCGGLGPYLGIDPKLLRIVFVLMALANGIGILIYLLLWLVIPYPDTATATASPNANELGERIHGMTDDWRDAFTKPNTQAPLWIGGGLILLGILLFAQNLNIWWLKWISFDMLWPLLLIVAGALLIWRRREDRAPAPPTPEPPRDSQSKTPPQIGAG